MLPVIALVGRPNVGKSTLFNQLTRSRDALVADLPGLTRDRKYGEGVSGDHRFIVIDTGGISGDEAGIDAAMAGQSLAAIEEADRVLLLVDGRAGLAAGDEQLVRELRRRGKPFDLVVNKVDGLDPEVAASDFYRLGIEDCYRIAASHGRGVRALIESVLVSFPPADAAPEAEEDRVRVAVVGRPNVGKSTLVNRLLGEERVVVFDQPGTTRDSVFIDFERDGAPYMLIDTAGVRRRKNVRETVEKFSIVKTLQAIDKANVVVLLMDGSEGLVDQDLHLLGHCIEAGRALVLAVNKWDGLEPEQRERMKSELERRLRFVDYAETYFISALHGSGVGLLFGAIDAAYEAATRPLSTNRLTRILQDALAEHPPPMVAGRRSKLRYAHAGGRNPPVIVIHGSGTDNIPASYRRYLEKTFARALSLSGTPVRVELRSGDNPYAGRRNTLSPRQQARKRRLMAHVKKDKKRRQRKKDR
ncbi:ribosome biogenesis GTPase Der [Pseudohaliea rubra]|uniref:GTPase Der n=1 Tax=Pseudohaliea rubra DSM 19751 TaxID=1265313 RepID=A0A095XZ04_9GAMM|nr:ribosome biogenesis GTPase Der [Pseudohaliea rubra]KGE04986.1 GTP-binding protein EngA [Pseudohaliea rubra DSM 19751]